LNAGSFDGVATGDGVAGAAAEGIEGDADGAGYAT